jgi:O-antigen ligase
MFSAGLLEGADEMAVLKRRRRSTGRDEAGQRIVARPEVGALAIFAALITLAPLAFGAVDQIIQAALLLLFAAGLALRPPSIVRPSPRTNALLIALAAVLVLKEFAPAALFGNVQWRTLLEQQFALDLPWTHHPEPGRAVDALLSGALAVLWLLWVRTLAAKRENRGWIAWSLTGAAGIVAAVSFISHSADARAIYGLRFTPGWLGFGPFPNRNHTACFLAMGVIMASGTMVWEIMRRRPIQAITAGLAALLSLAGMLATQSRGGVLALAAGLAIYAGFCLAKFRNRRALAIIAAIALVGVAVALAGGPTLFARFSAPTTADSNSSRVAIWGETLHLWGDAPLFGHGAASFASIYPLYTQLPLDNESVLHPESSWLQWLAEMGAVPVLLAVLLAGGWLAARARVAHASHRSFFLYAAGFSTFGALLCHSAVDVPAHRWATAAFALAALGLACPRPKPTAQELEWQVHPPHGGFARRAALVPLCVAVFWFLPLVADWPAWSPLTLQRQLAEAWRPSGTAAGLPRLLAYFPLSSELHHAVGLDDLRKGAPEAQWRAQFELANRLSPGFWRQTVDQALACERHFPAASLHFWQEAVERGSWRKEEIFNNAYEHTARLPGAHAAWAAFIDKHPALALEYVTFVSREEGATVFEKWWEERGSDRNVTLTAHEAKAFYKLAPSYSTAENFAIFMQARPALAQRDFLACAKALHAFGDNARAWHLLSIRQHEPELPPPLRGVLRTDLERRLRVSPDSAPNALALAALCLSEGDEAGAQSVIVSFARRPVAPPFFTHKAAYILKAQGKLEEAVEMMLRSGSVAAGQG